MIKKFISAIIIGFLLLAFCNRSQAQTNLWLRSAKAFINGSSSLHDWTSTIEKLEFKGTLETNGNAPKTLKDVELKITVESIKSKEGGIMDDKTYEAFKSDKFPFITYTFKNAIVKVDASNNLTVTSSGKLTMAGNTKKVTLTGTGKLLPNGDMQLSYSDKINMTDYGMKPPRAILGTIKVGEEVTVNFDLVLAEVKKQ